MVELYEDLELFRIFNSWVPDPFPAILLDGNLFSSIWCTRFIEDSRKNQLRLILEYPYELTLLPGQSVYVALKMADHYTTQIEPVTDSIECSLLGCKAFLQYVYLPLWNGYIVRLHNQSDNTVRMLENWNTVEDTIGIPFVNQALFSLDFRPTVLNHGISPDRCDHVKPYTMRMFGLRDIEGFRQEAAFDEDNDDSVDSEDSGIII